MLTRPSQQLGMICAGLVIWSSTPAAIHEIAGRTSRDFLSFNDDAFRWNTWACQYEPSADYGSMPRLPAVKQGSGNSGAGHSVLGAIPHAKAPSIHEAQMRNPCTLYWNDLGHNRPTRVSPHKDKYKVKDASPSAQESRPAIWAMALIGTGLVGYQLRRKTRSRAIRIASF
ncbi:MAG TPA: hypothetical protein VJT81_13510 [Burkholderiales bacterium]|nr:hypothetical protein [Burkholderiales bacterium]